MTNRCRLHATPDCPEERCRAEQGRDDPGMISASNAGAPVIVTGATLQHVAILNGDEMHGVFTIDKS